MLGGRFFLVLNHTELDDTTREKIKSEILETYKTQTHQRLSMVTVVTLLWALTDMDIFFSMNS